MPPACHLQTRKPEARATLNLRKFPPVLAQTRHHSIRRTENISPGARKPSPASKPINGDCFCMIGKEALRPNIIRSYRSISISQLEVLHGLLIRKRSSPPLKHKEWLRSSALGSRNKLY